MELECQITRLIPRLYSLAHLLFIARSLDWGQPYGRIDELSGYTSS
jgi:hypothetical protein